jgi:NAD(P)H-hydrate epimerase
VQKIISAPEMREIDRLTTEILNMPSLLLMEQAAACALHAISAYLMTDLRASHVNIFCGTGNNGGDGAALARLLWLARAKVEVFLIGRLSDARGDAQTNLDIVSRLAAESHNRDEGEIRFTQCATENDWREVENSLRVASRASDVIVDALFGTGLTRPVSGVHATVINFINEMRTGREAQEDESVYVEPRRTPNLCKPRIVSLDLPSGFVADKSESFGASVQADLTVTFTAPKLANVMPPASRASAQLVVCPVGTPQRLVSESTSQTFIADKQDAASWLRRTRYLAGSYKNTHGHALIIAGSRDMSGAPVLASNAAFRAGAGLVTLATPRSAHAHATARTLPEIMVAALDEDAAHGSVNLNALRRVRELARRATVIAIGPGLTSTSDETRNFVRELVLTRTTPVIIDADALNALAPWQSDVRGTPEAPLVLTPHEGEMRRLIGDTNDKAIAAHDPLADRIAAARDFAVAHEVYLVLKGERTIVAAPDARVCINPTGNPGLGTAGAGDTLTGIIASFIAQDRASRPTSETDTFASIVAALYIAGAASDNAAHKLGMRTMTPSDIADALSEIIRQLDPAGEKP